MPAAANTRAYVSRPFFKTVLGCELYDRNTCLLLRQISCYKRQATSNTSKRHERRKRCSVPRFILLRSCRRSRKSSREKERERGVPKFLSRPLSHSLTVHTHVRGFFIVLSIVSPLSFMNVPRTIRVHNIFMIGIFFPLPPPSPYTPSSFVFAEQ